MTGQCPNCNAQFLHRVKWLRGGRAIHWWQCTGCTVTTKEQRYLTEEKEQGKDE